jgi:hypothetical protein
MDLELEINSVRKPCDIDIYTKYLSGLRTDILSNQLNKNFMSQSLMESVRCISMIIDRDSDLFSMNERMREYIRSCVNKKDQDENEYSASVARYNVNSDGIFIIKSCENKETNETLREAALGLCILNDFRKITPVFRYIFDYVRCSPIVSSGKGEFAICSSNSGDGYIITEKIDSVTFREFAQLATLEDYIKMFTILCMSLKLVQSSNRVTFYNINSNSVIIRPCDHTTLNFDYKGKIIKIESEFIPVISQTDLAYFQLGTKINHSKNNLYELGVTDKFNEIIDVFHFLISSIITLKDEKNIIWESLMDLLIPFGILNYKSLLDTSKNLFKFNNLSVSMIQFIDILLKFSQKHNITLCCHDNYKIDLPIPRELESLGLSKPADQLSFFEYFELLDISPKLAAKHFNVIPAFEVEKKVLLPLINILKDKIEINVIELKSSSRYKDVYFLLRVKNKCNDFILYLNAYHRLKIHFIIGIEMISYAINITKEKMVDYYKKLERLLNDTKSSILITKANIEMELNNVGYIKSDSYHHSLQCVNDAINIGLL